MLLSLRSVGETSEKMAGNRFLSDFKQLGRSEPRSASKLSTLARRQRSCQLLGMLAGPTGTRR
jgi:hypothetical protein